MQGHREAEHAFSTVRPRGRISIGYSKRDTRIRSQRKSHVALLSHDKERLFIPMIFFPSSSRMTALKMLLRLHTDGGVASCVVNAQSRFDQFTENTDAPSLGPYVYTWAWFHISPTAKQ